MNIEQAISKVVRHEMLSNNLKVNQLSEQLGLCAQTVSNQLAGRTAWSVDRLYKFADIFRLDGSEILEQAERLVKLSNGSAKPIFGQTAAELTSKLTIK